MNINRIVGVSIPNNCNFKNDSFSFKYLSCKLIVVIVLGSVNLTSIAQVTRQNSVFIQPMTRVVVNVSGYFPDPLPINFAKEGLSSLYFAGSNKMILSSSTSTNAGAYSTTKIDIKLASFPEQAEAFGSTLISIGNNNIYQDKQGNWQMATTLHLIKATPSGIKKWNAIAHAHALNLSSPIPTIWILDKLLKMIK